MGTTACALLVGTALLDVITSLAGWRETTDTIRYWTGLLAGAAIAVALYPTVSLVGQGLAALHAAQGSTREWLGPIAASCLVGWAVVSAGGAAGGWAASGLAIAGLVSLWAGLNAILGILIFSRRGRVRGRRDVVVLAGGSICAAALELFLSSQMHSWVLAGGFG